MSVAAFIRAAIAVYARDGYCQRVANSKPDNPPKGLKTVLRPRRRSSLAR